MLGNYINSRKNEHINNELSYNNLNINHNNNNNVARNIQFLSGCNSDPFDQLPRLNHDSLGNAHSLHGGNPEHPVQISNTNNKNFPSLHNIYGEVRPIEHGAQGGIDQPTQSSSNINYNPLDQPPIGDLANQIVSSRTGDNTPKRSQVEITKRKLFNNLQIDEINKDVVPLDTDLEVLLINSCQINAIKVQTIINEFLTEKNYSTIFCMTETKVKGHDFQPIGIKLFSKHRSIKDKRGGG